MYTGDAGGLGLSLESLRAAGAAELIRAPKIGLKGVWEGSLEEIEVPATGDDDDFGLIWFGFIWDLGCCGSGGLKPVEVGGFILFCGRDGGDEGKGRRRGSGCRFVFSGLRTILIKTEAVILKGYYI